MLTIPSLLGARHQSPYVRALVVALLYLLGSELGHFLSFSNSHFATFWPPNGVLLAALLLSPRRQWTLLLLWCAAINHFSNVVLHGQNSLLSLCFVATNAIEALSAALLLHWWTKGRVQFTKLRTMLGLVGGAGIFCPMLGATLGTLALVSFGLDIDARQTWRIWWIADALGLLIVTPLALLWARPRRRATAAPSWPRILEMAILGLSLLLVANYVFRGQHFAFLLDQQLRMRFPIVLMPLLIWIALRFELRGTALANATIALIAVYCTSRGLGPFTLEWIQPATQLILLQAFLSLTTFISLMLGAGIAERRIAEQHQRRLTESLTKERLALHEQKELLQAILDSIGDGVVVVDNQGRLVQFNPAAERIHGRGAIQAPLEEWSQQYGLFTRDGQTPLPHEEQPLVQILSGKSTFSSIDAVLRNPISGEDVIINASARPVRNAQGEVVGGVAIVHDFTARARADEDRQKLIGELQQAISEIKTLKGLIPICACCKSIRDDEGYWQKLEAFLVEHTEAEFSHGICNDCGLKLYGEAWRQSMVDATIPTLPQPVVESSESPLRQ